MRKYFSLFFAITLLIGCNNDELLQTPNQAKPQEGDVALMAGKSVIEDEWDGGVSLRTSVDISGLSAKISWADGDEIGLWKIGTSGLEFEGVGENHSFLYKGEAEGVSGLKAGVFTNAMSDDDKPAKPFLAGNYIAYYPYSDNALNNGQIAFDLPVQCTGINNTLDNFEACDFMYVEAPIAYNPLQAAYAYIGQDQSGFTFKHGMAFLQFDLVPMLPEGTVVRQIEMRTEDPIFQQTILLDHTGSLSYGNPTNSMVLWIGEDGQGEAVTSNSTVWLLAATGTLTSWNREFKVYFRTDNGYYLAEASVPPVAANGFKGGSRYKITGLSDPTLGGSFILSKLIKSQVWDGSTILKPFINKETSKIYINIPDELAWVSAHSASALDADVPVDFAGYEIIVNKALDLGGHPWTPIAGFAGTFEGGSKVISGLTNSLFATNNGVISKVTVKNTIIGAEDNIVAEGVFGFIAKDNKQTIEGCHTNGCSIFTSGDVVGAIAGINTGTISSCVNGGSGVNKTFIKANKKVGGIVGTNGVNGRIEQCTANYSEINAHSIIGNIAGENLGTASGKGTIEKCTAINNTKITSSSGYAGGVVGDNSGLIDGCTLNKENTIITNSVGYIGGIAGRSTASNNKNGPLTQGEILNCKVNATGNAIEVKGLYAGGIVGQNKGSHIEKCTVSGITITGKNTSVTSVGGIVGSNDQNTPGFLAQGLLENCTVTAVTITSTMSSAANGIIGGIAGQNMAKIVGCQVSGSTLTGKAAAGGAVGNNTGTVVVVLVADDNTLAGTTLGGVVATQGATGAVVSCVSKYNGYMVGAVEASSSAVINYCVVADVDKTAPTNAGAFFAPLSEASTNVVANILNIPSERYEDPTKPTTSRYWIWTYNKTSGAFNYTKK